MFIINSIIIHLAGWLCQLYSYCWWSGCKLFSLYWHIFTVNSTEQNDAANCLGFIPYTTYNVFGGTLNPTQLQVHFILLHSIILLHCY